MDDDFGTPQVLATLFDLARDINRLSDEGYSVKQAKQVLVELGGVLGLNFKAPEEPPLNVELLEKILLTTGERVREEGLIIDIAASVLDTDSIMRLLISIRNRIREAKKFQLADEVRNKLGELGITLEDTPQGTVWRYKR